MRVRVKGFREVEEGDIIEQFVYFCADYLLGEEWTEGLSLRILTDVSLMQEAKWADCKAIDGDERYPAEFEIRVIGISRKLTLFMIMRLIAHEMIHVKQFATGELKFLAKGNVQWQDGCIPADCIDDWCEPWEIEARGHEKGLVELFCRENRYQKAPWYQQIP